VARLTKSQANSIGHSGVCARTSKSQATPLGIRRVCPTQRVRLLSLGIRVCGPTPEKSGYSIGHSGCGRLRESGYSIGPFGVCGRLRESGYSIGLRGVCPTQRCQAYSLGIRVCAALKSQALHWHSGVLPDSEVHGYSIGHFGCVPDSKIRPRRWHSGYVPRLKESQAYGVGRMGRSAKCPSQAGSVIRGLCQSQIRLNGLSTMYLRTASSSWASSNNSVVGFVFARTEACSGPALRRNPCD